MMHVLIISKEHNFFVYLELLGVHDSVFCEQITEDEQNQIQNN